MTDLVSVGYTKKPHGLKGEIKMEIEERYLDDLLETDVILLDLKGKPTPFFVQDMRVGNHIIAKLEGIDGPDTALTVASKEIFVRASDLKIANETKAAAGFTLEDCMGFKIYDNGKEIGEITEIAEYPQQLMAVVIIDDRETLIPLNDHFIVKIDEKRKLIMMELPEGLLEL